MLRGRFVLDREIAAQPDGTLALVPSAAEDLRQTTAGLSAALTPDTTRGILV